MPRYTQKHALRYAAGTDTIRDYPETSQGLAEKLDKIVPGENELVINGKAYKRSGVFTSIPSFSFRSAGGWGLGSVDIPVPYTPPAGYTFATYVLVSTGFTIAQTCGLAGDRQTIITRIIQGANTDSQALKRLGWTLVKEN